MSGLDLTLKLGDHDIELLDEQIQQNKALIERGNLEDVWDNLRTLRRGNQMRGLVSAATLYELSQQWEKLSKRGDVEDDFYNVAQAEVGYTRETIDKYVGMYTDIFSNEKVPNDIRERLRREFGVEHLLLIRAAVRDGLTQKQWKGLLGAKTKADVIKQVKSLRGDHTSSASALRLVLKRNGQLVAYKGKHGPVHVGLLNGSKTDLQDPIRLAAYERIVSCAGVMVE